MYCNFCNFPCRRPCPPPPPPPPRPIRPFILRDPGYGIFNVGLMAGSLNINLTQVANNTRDIMGNGTIIRLAAGKVYQVNYTTQATITGTGQYQVIPTINGTAFQIYSSYGSSFGATGTRNNASANGSFIIVANQNTTLQFSIATQLPAANLTNVTGSVSVVEYTPAVSQPRPPFRDGFQPRTPFHDDFQPQEPFRDEF